MSPPPPKPSSQASLTQKMADLFPEAPEFFLSAVAKKNRAEAAAQHKRSFFGWCCGKRNNHNHNGGTSDDSSNDRWFSESTLGEDADPYRRSSLGEEAESLLSRVEALMLMHGLAHEHYHRRALAWNVLILGLGATISILGLLAGGDAKFSFRLRTGIGVKGSATSEALMPVLAALGILLTILKFFENRGNDAYKTTIHRTAADLHRGIALDLVSGNDYDDEAADDGEAPGTPSAEKLGLARARTRALHGFRDTIPAPVKGAFADLRDRLDREGKKTEEGNLVRAAVSRRYHYRLARVHRRKPPSFLLPFAGAWWAACVATPRLYRDLDAECRGLTAAVLLSQTTGTNNNNTDKKTEADDDAIP